MECQRINNYVCPATFIGMINCMVSHGPGALETGPVCHGGAEEGTASRACMHSKQCGPLLAMLIVLAVLKGQRSGATSHVLAVHKGS
jgi:hypothetical protein